MSEPRTSARRVSAKVRRDRAVALRLAGATFEQIARTPTSDDDPRPLYTSRQRAQEAVDVALAELARETEGKAVELRALELARLDSMQVALWPSTRPTRPVMCPRCNETVLYREVDQGAVGQVLRIMERRSKYLRLDAEDEDSGRMVELLEQQVAMAQQALVGAMQRAGISPEQQREVLEHAADILREIDEADAP